MSLGLSSKFSILHQSPLDEIPERHAPVVEEGRVRLVPSRYNIRASAEDGRLIVWNSLRGTMNEFKPEQRVAVERLLSQKGFQAKLSGVVSYLYKRGFLVKDGTNEYRQIQMSFGQQQYRTDTLELILLASEDCNFRCTYCYEDFARGTMQPRVREGIKNLLRSRVAGLKTLSISWFGGEPLYGLSAIEDLAPFFLETSQRSNVTLSSGMTTNGYLLTPDVAKRLLAWQIKNFQITVDGTAEDHDRTRPTRSGEGTFAVIMENLQHLRAMPDNYRVNIRVNYDPSNSSRMNNFLDLAKEQFGGDSRFRIRFHAVGRWGGPNDEKIDICGAEDAQRIQAELKKEASQRGLSVSGSIREIKGPGMSVCYAARPYSFVIGASGQVMKCTVELDKHDRNIVGQISEDGELLLDMDKMALWTEPAFEADQKCQKCVVLPTCQGISCPLVRFESNKSPCIPLRLGAKKELKETVESGITQSASR